MWRRQMLAAAGVPESDVDILDRLLDEAVEMNTPVPIDRAARAAQIEAFVAASGGM
jgi:hypothetical protein